MTNLATYNHFNFNNSEAIKDQAVKTLRTYGVGPCGPPGFYGTQDVHQKLEADIASHLGSPASIIYAQSFSTISSVIPAFSKRGDIIVADKAVNFATRKGIQISRSTIRWYEHNDMEDLERVLAKLVKENARKPLTRRFIVTEGLFENVGDMVNLPKLVELKHKYKFRIILDETWSYGVLGRTGGGVTELQNVDAREIDMIIGSLAGSLCGGGGFCAGTHEIVEHQRLSANAYTFSAALPAMLATTSSETIRLLQEQPDLLMTLRENIRAMRAQLDPRSDWVVCSSVVDNPVMLLVLKKEVVEARKLSTRDQEQIIQDVVEEVSLGSCVLWYMSLTHMTVPGKRHSGHQVEEHATSVRCNAQRRGLATSTCHQAMCDIWTVKEGDREGRCHCQTCHHQDHDTQEVEMAVPVQRHGVDGGVSCSIKAHGSGWYVQYIILCKYNGELAFSCGQPFSTPASAIEGLRYREDCLSNGDC